MKPLKFRSLILLFGLTIPTLFAPGNPVNAASPEGAWEAKRSLHRSLDLAPRNPALAYYLGTVCLREGDLDGAVSAWETYLALAPDDPRVAATREMLTLLRMERARRFARENSRKDPDALARRADPRTVAVLSFGHDGLRENRLLAKGLAAMLITDLARVPGITVVERDKMHYLLQEMALGKSGVVDGRTATRAGRLLLAGKLVRGRLSGGDEIRISAATLDTLRAEETGSVRRQGPRSAIFAMEARLFLEVVEALGLTLPPAAGAKEHGKDYHAFVLYCEGLDAMDRGDLQAAREAFGRARDLDPFFDLALDALLALPRQFSWKDLEQLGQYAEESLGGPVPVPAVPSQEALEGWVSLLSGDLDPAVLDALLDSLTEESALGFLEDYLKQFGFTLPPIP